DSVFTAADVAGGFRFRTFYYRFIDDSDCAWFAGLQTDYPQHHSAFWLPSGLAGQYLTGRSMYCQFCPDHGGNPNLAPCDSFLYLRHFKFTAIRVDEYPDLKGLKPAGCQ